MSRKKANKLSAALFQRMIYENRAEAGVTLHDRVELETDEVKALPENLTLRWLTLKNCTALKSLPASLRVARLSFQGHWDYSHLLKGLNIYQLDLHHTSIDRLPDDLKVQFRLDLEDCPRLTELPAGLTTGVLILRGCTALTALPEGLTCDFLDMSGCRSIEQWPKHANVSVGRLAMRGCDQFRELPAWLTSIAQLDLRDCPNIRHVPETLKIGSWIDVAGTRIRSLPKHLKHVQIRWRGVPVEARIAFEPETITAEEIIAETNIEKRRVMLERMGYETFLSHANAETLDQDRDTGGPRRLVRVPMKDDEDLVCVSVICPSTDRQYVIRVPPGMTTCHQAVAWVAGFDDPAEYQPLVET
jgi:hypothetical protein